MLNVNGTFRVGLAFDANGGFVRLELKDASGAVVGTLNLHEFDHAMTMANDLVETARQAWPEKIRQLEAMEAATRPTVVAVIAIPSKGSGGTVPCMKGHLHADVTNARACEADPKIPPMVGAVKH